MVVVEVVKDGDQDTNGDWDYCSLHSGLLLLLFLFLFLLFLFINFVAMEVCILHLFN